MEVYFLLVDHCTAWTLPPGLCRRLYGSRCPKPYREGAGSAPLFNDRGKIPAATQRAVCARGTRMVLFSKQDCK
jgi:hypothetical protein